jgi:FkbM family methyltransferase
MRISVGVSPDSKPPQRASWKVRLLRRVPRSLLKAIARQQWRHPLLRRSYDAMVRRLAAREGIITQGVGQGLRFHPAQGHVGYLLGTTEPAVQAALRALVRPGMVVYDIGANVGFFTVILARLVGPTGRVVAFEPLAQNVGWLHHNVRANGFDHVDVRSEAVGATSGTMSFLVSTQSSWGSLASSGKRVARPAGTIDVSVIRLDELAATNAPLPHLLKIDIEGSEVDALRGAAALLERARPILLVELHATQPAVAELLERYRYRSVVLGSMSDVTRAPWDAHVVAVPVERSELVARLEEFTTPQYLST